MTRDDAKQATPHQELITRLLDSRIAKSEVEWAAKREIERLREALTAPAAAGEDVEFRSALEAALAQHYGFVSADVVGIVLARLRAVPQMAPVR
jgi:hypothetical protein